MFSKEIRGLEIGRAAEDIPKIIINTKYFCMKILFIDTMYKTILLLNVC
jgi:hypothetical protein